VARRSGLDESFHEGAVVGLASDGSVAFTVGDPNVVIYPRSCCKPMQAAAMLRAGLRLPAPLLALACASHSGQSEHVTGVRALLSIADLDDSALHNTPDLPIDAESAAEVLRAGGGRSPLWQTCSGKHAAMVVTCALNGWLGGDAYLAPDHPLQERITQTIADLAGEEPAHVGVDGCGAPAHALSLLGLARAFQAVVEREPEVAGAMTSYPHLVAGRGRDSTAFMEAVPGLLAKGGAEGVYAAAMPDGRAVAVKIADGSARARPAVVAAALSLLGVDMTAAAPVWTVPVLGHGQTVGEVRPAGPLAGVLRHVGR
jgi:L-asparaginase II